MRVAIPNDGTDVVVDVPLTTPSSIANAMARPFCLGGLGPIAAEGFVHVDHTHPFVATLDDRPERFPQGVHFAEVECRSLYRLGSPDTCVVQQPSGGSLSLPRYSTVQTDVGKIDTTLLFSVTAFTESQPTLHVRFKKEF
jgi:hypothetical protein